MLTRSTVSAIADEVIADGVIADGVIAGARRDGAFRTAWRFGSLPAWFNGPHLAGLDEIERRARFDDLAWRATRRPDWILFTATLVILVLAALGYLSGLPMAYIACMPAALVMISRQWAMRRQFARDARTFAERRDASPR